MVCRSVCHTSEPSKTLHRSTCRLDWGLRWAEGTRYHMEVQINTWEGAILRGKGVSNCKAYGNSAVTCAKNGWTIWAVHLRAEGTWKHKFNRIHRVVPMCPHVWQHTRQMSKMARVETREKKLWWRVRQRLTPTGRRSWRPRWLLARETCVHTLLQHNRNNVIISTLLCDIKRFNNTIKSTWLNDCLFLIVFFNLLS